MPVPGRLIVIPSDSRLEPREMAFTAHILRNSHQVRKQIMRSQTSVLSYIVSYI